MSGSFAYYPALRSESLTSYLRSRISERMSKHIEVDTDHFAMAVAILRVLDPESVVGTSDIGPALHRVEALLTSGATEDEVVNAIKDLAPLWTPFMIHHQYEGEGRVEAKWWQLLLRCFGRPMSHDLFDGKQPEIEDIELRDLGLRHALSSIAPVDISNLPEVGSRYGMEQAFGSIGIQPRMQSEVGKRGAAAFTRRTATADPACLLRPSRLNLPFTNSYLQRLAISTLR